MRRAKCCAHAPCIGGRLERREALRRQARPCPYSAHRPPRIALSVSARDDRASNDGGSTLAALHRARAGHPAAVARGGVRARLPRARLGDDAEAARKLVEAKFALRRGDCAELPPLRGPPCRPHLRGQCRPDDRAEEVRPTRGHALRDVRRPLDPRLRARPRDPRVEHRRRRRRARCGRRCSSGSGARRRRSSRRRATR